MKTLCTLVYVMTALTAVQGLYMLNTAVAADGKVGLGWSNGNSDPSIANFVTSQVKFVYTWSPYCPEDTAKLNLTCMPMLRDSSQIQDFQNLVIEGYSDIVASFNEPNWDGQANLDPEDAAALHTQYVDPLKLSGYKIVSPATSQASNGLSWMQNFMKACADCQFDYVAVHYYDTSFDAFKTYLELWHSTFNIPILVTEFSCLNIEGGPQATDDEVWAFWSQAVEYMESQPWIVAYFGYGLTDETLGGNSFNQLMGANNEPTALGDCYINVSW